MTDTQKTYSPIDNSLYVERPLASRSQIAAAQTRAVNAQTHWNRVPLSARLEICRNAVGSFVAMSSIIAEELTWQMGRPIQYAAGEISGLEERANYMIDVAESALAPVHANGDPCIQRYIRLEPVGLVLVVAPWNYPYLTAINTVMPAIAAGNAVIIKHSAQTPLCAERLVQAFHDAGLPEDVFQYLHMSHDDTAHLIRSSHINHVAFTGSVKAGFEIESAAAGRFIGVGLELGGKDPAYVRADANLEHAVNNIVDGAFFNSGQSCCGIERIYVDESVHDEFVEMASAIVRRYKLGRPDDPTTTLGPVVRASSADFIRGQIRDAIEQGATARIDAGEFPLDAEATPYLAPQLLTGVNHSMRVMTEESFGPVVGVQKVTDDDTAIDLMNDSDFGLTASIFTRDLAAGTALAERIDTGTAFVNRCDYLDPALAWTGVKNSGRGCSLSVLGYHSITRPKSFHINSEHGEVGGD